MLSARCQVFFLLIIATFVANSEQRRPYPNTKCEKCNLAFRCSPYFSEELVWGIVDGVCKVWANGCMKASYDCQRKNDCKPEVVDSNQKECQQLCASGCDAKPDDPQCAWIAKLSPNGTPAEENKSFRNRCEVEKWSCENAIPVASSNPGNCA